MCVCEYYYYHHYYFCRKIILFIVTNSNSKQKAKKKVYIYVCVYICVCTLCVSLDTMKLLLVHILTFYWFCGSFFHAFFLSNRSLNHSVKSFIPIPHPRIFS